MSSTIQATSESVSTTRSVPSDLANIPRIFKSQRENRWSMAATTASERIAMLERLRQAIIDRKEGLCAALFEDLRKHPAEVELTEYQTALVEIGHTIKHLRKWMRPTRVTTPITLTGTRSEVRYEPKGVVLIIAPWNYPFSLVINPLVAALSAGNCVVIKPSEKTPATSAYLADLVRSVFKEHEVAVVEGEVAESKALLDLPFDHFFFTGSTQVGKIVMEAASKHLASVTLELGGKSPVIVDQSADVKAAARRIVWGKFLNAGQTCVAPDYLFVHTSLYKPFLDEAKKALGALYGEDENSRKASTDFCRIVDDARFIHLSRLLDDAVARGAQVVVGGQTDRSQKYIAPTVLTNVDLKAEIMQEEIFGPILPVFEYSALDEPIQRIQSNGKPLALYVFSQDRQNIETILNRTSAGGTAINNVVVQLTNPNLPFGGVGESGLGNYHGPFGFKAFSHERAVMRQTWLDTFKNLYPPYSPRVQRMLDFVTKWVSR